MEQHEQINLASEDLKKKLSSKQPSLEELNDVLSSLQQSPSWDSWDVGKPLGSATRIELFQKISTPPHWKSCKKCSVSMTGNPQISPKFYKF